MELLNKHKSGTPLGAVYIGRGSPFGNLKVIGKDGTRAEVIQWYRGWLADKLISRDPIIETTFKDLKEDSKLLCFCHPAPCHGAVIVEYWKEIFTYSNYEEGLKAFATKQERKIITAVPTNESYRTWLVDKLISRDPKVSEDFRLLELSTILIPECFRHLKDLTEKVIIPLYDKLVVPGDYDTALKYLIQTKGKMPEYEPLMDGITHINVYSKGKTKLGRSLTNFANIGFDHPEYGRFESVEGFWYWLKTGMQHDSLRTLHGFKAKEEGKKFERVDVCNFEQQIKLAILYKVEQCLPLKQALKDSTLPLSHYYWYGSENNCKIIANDEFKWLVDYLELIRRYIKADAHKVIIAGSRSITDYHAVKQDYLVSGFDAVLFVSGGAKGVDRLGEELANELKIPIQRFIPDWDGLGKRAGMVRNIAMGDYADTLVAVYDGTSKGTKQMIDYMQSLNKPVYIFNTAL